MSSSSFGQSSHSRLQIWKFPNQGDSNHNNDGINSGEELYESNADSKPRRRRRRRTRRGQKKMVFIHGQSMNNMEIMQAMQKKYDDDYDDDDDEGDECVDDEDDDDEDDDDDDDDEDDDNEDESELDLSQISFDTELVRALIVLLYGGGDGDSGGNDGRGQGQGQRPRRWRQRSYWEKIRITSCSGDSLNDVLMTILSPTNVHLKSFTFIDPSSTNVFSSSSMINSMIYGIQYLPTMVDLSLSITIDPPTLDALARAIAQNSTLQTLNLSRCCVTSGVDVPAVGGGRILGRAGTRRNNSVYTNSNVHMSRKAAITSLSFALRINTSLKTLCLDYCQFEDDCMATLLLALQDHPNLSNLSIRQNACHTEGMAAIATLLHYNHALTELDMSFLVRKKREPKPAPKPATDAKKNPSNASAKKSVKTRQDLENEQKDDGEEEDEKPPADGDGDDKQDDDDDDEETEEDDEEEEQQARVQNKNLKVFQLAGNGLTDEFVQSLLNIFGKTSTIEELNLFANRITDVGLEMIINKLGGTDHSHHHNSHLQEQQQQHDGAKTSRKNTTTKSRKATTLLRHVKHLWLGHNSFTTKSVRKLVNQLANGQNYSLESIKVQRMMSFGSRSVVSDDEKDEWERLQLLLDHYGRLNRGGRRIFADYYINNEYDDDDDDDDGGAGDVAQTDNDHHNNSNGDDISSPSEAATSKISDTVLDAEQATATGPAAEAAATNTEETKCSDSTKPSNDNDDDDDLNADEMKSTDQQTATTTTTATTTVTNTGTAATSSSTTAATESMSGEDAENNHTSSNTPSRTRRSRRHHRGDVPLGLWPLVLERANRLYYWEPADDDSNNNDSKKKKSTKNKKKTTTKAGTVDSAAAKGQEDKAEGKEEKQQQQRQRQEKNITKEETRTISPNCSYAADVIFCLLHGPVLFENPNIVVGSTSDSTTAQQHT